MLGCFVLGVFYLHRTCCSNRCFLCRLVRTGLGHLLKDTCTGRNLGNGSVHLKRGVSPKELPPRLRDSNRNPDRLVVSLLHSRLKVGEVLVETSKLHRADLGCQRSHTLFALLANPETDTGVGYTEHRTDFTQ